MSLPVLIQVLARSLSSGEMTVEAALARVRQTLGRNWRWLGPLTRRFVEEFQAGTRPTLEQVRQFLLHDDEFRAAFQKYSSEIEIAEWISPPQIMQPVAAAANWKLPSIESAGALADWLSLDVSELEWFADLKGLTHATDKPKLRHYRYGFLRKRSGGVRVIESPKPRLKALQRKILTGILDHVPAHRCAHGFVKNRSILTFAAEHTSKAVLLRLDLQDFFPSCPASRIQATFRTLGYPDGVASLLAGICSNALPPDVWEGCGAEFDWQTRLLYGRPHLPQGSPASPALGNI